MSYPGWSFPKEVGLDHMNAWKLFPTSVIQELQQVLCQVCLPEKLCKSCRLWTETCTRRRACGHAVSTADEDFALILALPMPCCAASGQLLDFPLSRPPASPPQTWPSHGSVAKALPSSRTAGSGEAQSISIAVVAATETGVVTRAHSWERTDVNPATHK